jgi:hypothetical protein
VSPPLLIRAWRSDFQHTQNYKYVYILTVPKPMLTVLARLTLWKTRSKMSSVLLSWVSGTPYSGTQQNRSDKMHR